MLFKRVLRLFESGNVMVSGLRGSGKDVLFGNVISRRKKDYVSNLNYTDSVNYHVLDFEKIDCGKNTYKNLLSGDVLFYEYPYPEGADIYLSDAGIYFPSQYCNELNKAYPYLPVYMALSRQVSHNNFHINVQSLNRAWDKIREQSDIYIMCVSVNKFLARFGIILQRIIIYDKYQSAVDRVKPCRIKVPLISLNPKVRQDAQIALDKFANQYGEVRSHTLLYLNKSKHDTYYFEKLFKGGRKIW